VVEKHIGGSESKEIFYAELEQFAREKIRGHLQDLLEQEVSEWLGREKSERKVKADEQPGYRNGYGRPRRLTMSLGTLEIQRPRVRDLSERFKSKVLPMFKRQTQEVRDLMPELYLHGLASGDFELALRQLLGEGAPLSASSLQRLKEKWQNEYTQWTNVPIEQGRLGVLVGRWDLRQSGVGQGEGGVAGGDRSKERRQQVFFGVGSGLSREQRVVGRCLTSAQGAWGKTAPALCGRWQSGIMGGGERGLSPGSTTVVLES